MRTDVDAMYAELQRDLDKASDEAEALCDAVDGNDEERIQELKSEIRGLEEEIGELEDEIDELKERRRSIGPDRGPARLEELRAILRSHGSRKP